MMQILNEYKTKLFGIYWLRWMLSAIVMLPFMLLFEYMELTLWINLFLGQTIGSLIFFKIDKLIFNNKESKAIEEEFDAINKALH